MNLISDYMTRHHQACDDALARAENAAAASDTAGLEREGAAFLREMERHIAMEEDQLFPAFERATGGGGGPTEMMRMEHAQMRGLFDQMREAIDAGQPSEYLGAAETLLVLLQQHNMKEEGMLYPMMDEALSGEAAALIAGLEESAA